MSHTNTNFCDKNNIPLHDTGNYLEINLTNHMGLQYQSAAQTVRWGSKKLAYRPINNPCDEFII